MKFNREHLEELTLQKIKEVNDEAGYRSYLEVPEMVNIIASIMEEKFNVLFDSQKDQIRSLRAYNDILEKENDSMTDTETKTLKQYEEDWKRIFKTKDQEIEDLKNTIQDLTTELEEYRAIAEKVGAEKAVSEKEKLEKILEEIRGELPIWTSTVGAYTLENIPKRIKLLVKEVEDRLKSYSEIMDLCEKEGRLREEYEKIINDTLRALPVGNINTHTPDTIPERVQDWVREAAEECSLREKWEELADKLISFAEIITEIEGNSTRNTQYYNSASEAIEQYEKLKRFTDGTIQN